MRKYLNEGNIPLAVAVFLATDNYDHDDQTVSATALLKPLRQLILAGRIPQGDALVDIAHLVKSRIGSAIHDSIEAAWVVNYRPAMRALGYPERLIDKVVLNPLPGEASEDAIPVYLEQRKYREISEVTVSGKFDFVAEGEVADFKTTGVYTYIHNTKQDDYILQGSIYRWLSPNIITGDNMHVHFIFTDWQGARAREPGYPPRQQHTVTYPLLSLEETEKFIKNKLAQLALHKNTPEPDLPLCTDKELWRKAPHWKYYKNPQKTTRSTKNFDNMQDAYARLSADGNVGIVVEKPGEVVACKYCPAYSICSQKDSLIADGSLQI